MQHHLTLALMATGRLSLTDIKTLYDNAGSAEDVIQHRNDIRVIAPEASDRLTELMKQDISDYQRRAEEEIKWCEQNKVTIRLISDAEYPDRLRHCHDAPMALFTRGKADLNATHVINMVGTRKCTNYGMDVIAKIVADISRTLPDITIVSGLAYGIDIAAHKAAMNNGLPTIGVVAHGQDTMYPNLHRNEANKMCLGNGGVITEFFHGTRPIAQNFLQRNRIIAGMSDATIVIESAAHGGGLVTARIAQDYGREVFAIPGPINSEMSAGTNNMIRDNKAALITSAQDIVNMMQWQNDIALQNVRDKGIERSLFVDLTPDEQRIVNLLREQGDMQANSIALVSGIPISQVSSLLFSLEMKTVIKSLPGNTFHLIS